MRILKLTLNKKWFDMILSGEKKEEYRELKEYWKTRLTNREKPEYRLISLQGFLTLALPNDFFAKYDYVEFTNGYGGKMPTMLIECLGISKGYGEPKWGAEEETEYIVIKLGKIVETKNI